MSRPTPDQVLATPAGDLAALQSEVLFQLKNDAADLLSVARAIVEHIDRALDLKYADRAHALRLVAGKDTGVVHFDDGNVRITADQRLAERRGVKGVLVGKSGIGKTSQLWTLKPTATLFFDLEAGDLAVEGWAGDTIRPRTWQECRDFAVYIGGPNPALRDDQPFSQAHFDAACARFGDPTVLDKYDTVFVDSITVAGRLCLQWCKGQPQAYSENGRR